MELEGVHVRVYTIINRNDKRTTKNIKNRSQGGVFVLASLASPTSSPASGLPNAAPTASHGHSPRGQHALYLHVLTQPLRHHRYR